MSATPKWLLPSMLALAIGLGVGGAQDYSLIRSTIDGGGGRSAGGRYTVDATIGQPDVGDAGGGRYSLAGGYWGAIHVIQAPEGPRLSIGYDAEGDRFTVSWTLPDDGWVLDSSADLGLGSPWTEIPAEEYQHNDTHRFVVIEATGGRGFFRLRRN